MSNELDSFFRESLGMMEVTPSSASWTEVQNRISSKKNAFWNNSLKLAAAVTVVLTFTVIILQHVNPKAITSPIASIDYPTDIESFEYKWQLPDKKEVKKHTTQVAQAAAMQGEELYEKIESLELRSIAYQRIDTPISTQLTLIKTQNEEPTIKITYIGSNAESEKSKKLNDLLAKLTTESPTEILADIRDVKDNLLNRN